MTQRPYQLLHWVFKVGNLKTELDFYKSLGMRVLRHEEFSQGCDAQCNGPYARPWSKTMVGMGNEDECFVMELAFNYGITKYECGNDFRHVILGEGEIKLSPCGYAFKGRGSAVKGVSLNVKQLGRAVDYYTGVLGMKLVNEGSVDGKPFACLGYSEHIFVELVESGEDIQFAKAAGRLAIAVPTDSITAIERRVKNEQIHTPRVKLETPGKATVEVVILLDNDGYEICIVGADPFFELAKPFPGCNVIDWNKRKENGSKE